MPPAPDTVTLHGAAAATAAARVREAFTAADVLPLVLGLLDRPLSLGPRVREDDVAQVQLVLTLIRCAPGSKKGGGLFHPERRGLLDLVLHPLSWGG